MRHLYVQIYVALVAILILFGVLVFATWHLLPPIEERQQLMTGSAAVLSDLLPAKERPITETQAALDRLYDQLGVDLSLYGADAKLLAAAGEVIPAPDFSDRESGWIHGKGDGPRIALHLADGRWLIVRTHHDRGASWLAMLVLLAIAVAIGAYPIVRRITRRLERLQKRVDQLGAGELSARVEVQGNDEVAQLARDGQEPSDMPKPAPLIALNSIFMYLSLGRYVARRNITRRLLSTKNVRWRAGFSFFANVIGGHGDRYFTCQMAKFGSTA